MIRTIVRSACLATGLLLPAIGRVAAQQAMTVVGHVSYQGAPLSGARVTFDQLRLERTTDATGRYSFVIPASSVRGQSATLTARMDSRHVFYRPQSVEVVLAGSSIVQDFALTIAERPLASHDGGFRQGPTISEGLPVYEPPGSPGRTDDLNLFEALAGRIAGLDVLTSPAPGGTSRLQYRGPRSFVGSSQPLFVLDGTPLDNTAFGSSAARAGLGGFDYGSPLEDIDLANVMSIRWLNGAEATARYGGRAANGVLLVSTSHGGDVLGLSVSASQLVSSTAPLRLPALQNAYGQGLNGKFQFFDGRGGGINDNVDQSWGPALDGRPLQQASLTEAGRPDVRLWAPMPNNVRDYFRGGRTTISTAALERGGARSALRVFFTARDTRGLIPENELLQRDGGASVTVQATPSLSASASATIGRTTNSNAPGTGFGEGNVVAQFARTGRQVDILALRDHLRDSTGQQVSWSYSGHDNPYFAALENSNESRRTHKVGSVSATYVPAAWLSASVRGGIDDYDDARRLSIASGWVGGFPSVLSAVGDYTRGGLQQDNIGVRRTSGAVSFDATRKIREDLRWSTLIGADIEALRQEITSVGVDSGTVLPNGAPSTGWSGQGTRSGAFAKTGLAFGEAGGIDASLRHEWSSLGTSQTASTLYPAINASLDVTRVLSSSQAAPATGLALHAAWARTAGELTPYALQQAYPGAVATGSIAPQANLVGADSVAPEMTTSAEAGLTLSLARGRLSLGATVYSENTDGVLLAAYGAASPSVSAHSGRLSNRGVESRADLHLGNNAGRFEWRLVATAARNMNQLDSLQDATQTIALGPSLLGIALQGRVGQPLGVLVGTKLLRDPASGELLLRNGLPLPDSVAGPQQLGVSQPTWVLGLHNSFRYRRVTFALQADGHLGGDIFSATQMWGTYSGTLAATAVRPDSGLLIAGRDVVSGTANIQHVTAQDYYHAIGSIQEPWVSSATYAKLREARLGLQLPTTLWNLPFESATVALVGRNLLVWSRATGVDPESQFGSLAYSGVELGQLPYARTLGVQLSITP